LIEKREPRGASRKNNLGGRGGGVEMWFLYGNYRLILKKWGLAVK